MGASVNGKPSDSKSETGGSIPSAPAKIRQKEKKLLQSCLMYEVRVPTKKDAL